MNIPQYHDEQFLSIHSSPNLVCDELYNLYAGLLKSRVFLVIFIFCFIGNGRPWLPSLNERKGKCGDPVQML